MAHAKPTIEIRHGKKRATVKTKKLAGAYSRGGSELWMYVPTMTSLRAGLKKVGAGKADADELWETIQFNGADGDRSGEATIEEPFDPSKDARGAWEISWKASAGLTEEDYED